MNQEKKELILNRLTRAQDTLCDAKILFENSRLFSTVNRIYYAMFYAVSGLLLTKDLSSAKHSGVMSLFNKEFVNEGHVSKETGRFYNEMFEFRQKADYRDLVEFKREEVSRWLEEAGAFVTEIKSLTEAIVKEG